MTNQKKTKTVCVQPVGQDYFSWKAALCLIGGGRTLPAVLELGLHLPYTILHCGLNSSMRWLGYHSFFAIV